MPTTDDFEGRDDRDDHNEDRPRRRRRREYDDDDFESGPPQSNPYGVISLVLGLLSFICGLLSGIPAIIFGILGISRAKRARGAGHGLSVAGIVLGCCSLFFTAILIGLMLPAVQKVREAASRATTTNNAKMMGLAMQNYHDEYDGFPRAVYDPKKVGFKNGKGLSWRVGLLPFLEQSNLHDSFKLDQSWDSAANQALSSTIIRQYTNPDEQTPQTRFQVFVGRNTVFDPNGEPIQLRDIKDGPSNTLLFLEAGTPVPWASPQDIPYTPNGALPAFGRPGQSGFLVGFADGTVRNINKKVNPKWMHAMIQTNDGVIVDFNALDD